MIPDIKKLTFVSTSVSKAAAAVVATTAFTLLVIAGCSAPAANYDGTPAADGAGATNYAGVTSANYAGAHPANYAEATSANVALYSDDYIVDGGPVEGGEIRLYSTLPDTFNPLLTRNAYTRALLGLIYEGLAAPGSERDIVPCLAEGWNVSEDGLTWTVPLKGDVRWQDGPDFSARDVTHTISLIRSYGELCPYGAMLANVESVSEGAADVLTFKLIRENAFFPYTLVFPIVPSHVDEGELDAVYGEGSLRQGLVGTGPYRFMAYTPNDSITLTADDAWHSGNAAAAVAASMAVDTDTAADASTAVDTDTAASSGPASTVSPPYIQDVRFIFYPPEEAALTQFRTREVDMFFSRSFEYAKYRMSPEMQIKRYCEREFTFISFNTQRGATASKDVRRALSRLIDRDALVDTALKGRGVPAEYPVAPGDALYTAVNTRSTYDPQAAAAILDGAGLTADGIAFGLLVNGDDAEQRLIAEYLLGELTALGVTLNVTYEPRDAVAQKVAAGDYEAALLNYRTGPYPDMTELYSTPWFTGTPAPQVTPGGENGAAEAEDAADNGDAVNAVDAVTAPDVINPARYRNDEVDRLAAALYILYDERDRQTAFAELVAAIQDDAPYIGLCFRASSLVCGGELLGGYYPSALAPLAGFESRYLADYL